LIRSATVADAEAIGAIYNHYIRETIVTFEEEPVSAADMRSRIEEVAAASLPWLVAEQAGAVVGYARATKWRPRSAYRFSVESTIYLAPQHAGAGLGTMLYRELISQLNQRGLHRVIGGVALPNAASVALHEKLGFRKVAHFGEVGFKLGRWIDVAYWELALGPSPGHTVGA
jgi:phosphinothricin acetyltransferase